MPSDSDAPSELWLAPGFLVGVQVAGARVPGDEFTKDLGKLNPLRWPDFQFFFV